MTTTDIAKACYEAHREFHTAISHGSSGRPCWEEMTEQSRDDIEHQVEARLRTPGLGVTINATPKDLIYFAVIHTLRGEIEPEKFTVSPLMMPCEVPVNVDKSRPYA